MEGAFKIQILGIVINLLNLNPWEFAPGISVLNTFPGDSEAGILWTSVWESLSEISSCALCSLPKGQREGRAIHPGLEGKPRLTKILQKSPSPCHEAPVLSRIQIQLPKGGPREQWFRQEESCTLSQAAVRMLVAQSVQPHRVTGLGGLGCCVWLPCTL